jgi:hypothetical protein
MAWPKWDRESSNALSIHYTIDPPNDFSTDSPNAVAIRPTREKEQLMKRPDSKRTATAKAHTILMREARKAKRQTQKAN